MTDKAWLAFIESLRDSDADVRSLRHNGFSADRWNQLAESGVFAAFSDSSGDGYGLKNAIHRMRELGRISPERGLTFSAVTQIASTIYCLRNFADSDLQQRYLPEAEAGTAIGGHAITEEKAGSDLRNMATTATLEGDHYVLTGTKCFITNAPVASTLVVYARTVENGYEQGISAFLVETAWPGVDVSEMMPTAGLRTSPIGRVHLNQVFIPSGNRIGHTGAGMLILDQVMKREILLAFSGNIGEMEQLVERSVKHVNEREQFGSSIGRNQLVANRIVETQIAIELGGSLIDSIASRIDGFEDVTIPVAAAKIFISEANVASALNAIQIHGGKGYLTSSPFSDDLMDAVPGTIYSGSNDVLRAKIATMLGVVGSR